MSFGKNESWAKDVTGCCCMCIMRYMYIIISLNNWVCADMITSLFSPIPIQDRRLGCYQIYSDVRGISPYRIVPKV